MSSEKTWREIYKKWQPVSDNIVAADHGKWRLRFGLRTIFVVITVFAVVMGYVTWLFRNPIAEFELAQIDLGKAGIAIIAERWDRFERFEETRHIYCRIEGKTRDQDFPWRSMATISDWTIPGGAEQKMLSLKFSAVMANDGELVGIIDSRNPDTIIDLFDFRTHERLGFERPSSNEWKQKRLQELENAYPGRTFNLNSRAC